MQSVTEPHDDRLERLKKSVEYPERWDPAEGETLAGKLSGWETVTKDDWSCEVATIKRQDGSEMAVWTFAASLRYKLIAPKDGHDWGRDKSGAEVPHEQRLAHTGDFIAVNYVGKRPIQTGPFAGKDSHAYRVGIERPQNGGEADADIPF